MVRKKCQENFKLAACDTACFKKESDLFADCGRHVMLWSRDRWLAEQKDGSAKQSGNMVGCCKSNGEPNEQHQQALSLQKSSVSVRLVLSS